MTEAFSRIQKLELVGRSPAAVAAKDRDAWLSIFSSYAIVEDPVGSAPHVCGTFDRKSGSRGKGVLARFFDTFIAPNRITFFVDHDIVCGGHVVRDLTIEIQMSPTITVQVPMHLVYELEPEGGQLRIRRLAAHWELAPMVGQLFGKGRSAWSVLLALGGRMMRIQGLAGALGFSRGFLGIGARGRRGVEQFIQAFNARSTARVADLFEPFNQGVALPYGALSLSPVDVCDVTDIQLIQGKTLVAGYSVSVSLLVETGGKRIPGVGIFDFNRKSRLLDGVRIYWES